MNTLNVVMTISALMAFLACYFVFQGLSRSLEHAKVRARAKNVSAHENIGALVFRNGIPLLALPTRFVIRIPAWCTSMQYLQEKVRDRGYSSTTESMSQISLGAVLACVGAGCAIFGSPVVGIACVCCVGASIYFIAKREMRIRADQIRESVPEALRALSDCFSAGLTILQTFKQVSKETTGPLKELFVRAAGDLEAGRTVDEALERFRSGSHVHELTFVAIALDIQHRAGGRLRQVLDTACEAVEGELELKRTLRVQTAQAKLSAQVVSVMPFALIFLFSMISENFLSSFFESPQGLALLTCALCMLAAGIMIVRKMLDVEVE